MKKLLLTLTALTLIATGAYADILWDQSDVSADSYFDSESAGMWGTVIVYGASDFNLGTAAAITSVTTIYDNPGLGYWEAGNYTALLDIFAKTGPTPVTGTDDPLATGLTVPVSLTDNGDGTFNLTASSLNIPLAAGDYWIMLSPTIAEGASGASFHRMSTSVWGDNSAWIEFGGWMAPSWGSRWGDGSLIIEGTMAVATENDSWGNVKAIYR